MTEKTKPTFLLEVDEFQHYLDHSGMSELEKEEALQTIWNMVCEFVMIGFNVHPVQQAKDTEASESTDLQQNSTVQCADNAPIHEMLQALKKNT